MFLAPEIYFYFFSLVFYIAHSKFPENNTDFNSIQFLSKIRHTGKGFPKAEGNWKRDDFEIIYKSTQYSFPKNFTSYDYYRINVGNSVCGKLQHFWKSTGLCPPDPHQEAFKFLLSSEMCQNLALIGALPQKGIEQVRIHWLLNLVQIKMTSNATFYNFTYLDLLTDYLKEHNLMPGFELMGNPSQLFSDFENSTQVYMWRNFIAALANHYILRYGIKYVSRWNFETWNEPDHHDFDGLNFTMQGFLNYYDACSEGLKMASKRLHFGGPGGSCHIPNSSFSPICWELLQHCQSGKNFFTGEVGNRLDFISFHKKGNGSSLNILNQELETIRYIRENFVHLNSVPIYNDEGDPLKTWSLPQWWRADATYAAMVAKVVSQHIQYFYIKKDNFSESVQYRLLSNDNAFLSYFPNQFSERTLLARFQVNNTISKYVQFVQKPVYAVMGLLSKLCNVLLNFEIHENDGRNFSKSDVGVVASRCLSNDIELSILIYNSRDTMYASGAAHINLTVDFPLKSATNMKWVLYEVNNKKTNPYEVWMAMGHPAYPTMKQFSKIKEHEEPHMELPKDLHDIPPWTFNVILQRPGVSLLYICTKGLRPQRVKNLSLLKINEMAIQITWKDNKNKCILTYNVEHSRKLYGPFKKQNKRRIIFPSYWHACLSSSTSSIRMTHPRDVIWGVTEMIIHY